MQLVVNACLALLGTSKVAVQIWLKVLRPFHDNHAAASSHGPHTDECLTHAHPSDCFPCPCTMYHSPQAVEATNFLVHMGKQPNSTACSVAQLKRAGSTGLKWPACKVHASYMVHIHGIMNKIACMHTYASKHLSNLVTCSDLYLPT